jgi:hypothetical protein
MKAIAALTVIAVGAAIAGCSSTAAVPVDAGPAGTTTAQQLATTLADRAWPASGTAPSPGTPLRIRTLEYSSVVGNAGAPGAFTAFVVVWRTLSVQPSSAASVVTTGAGDPRFAIAKDRANWVAAGSPALGQGTGTIQESSLPAGQFSFLPQGAPLTYQEAASMPSSPGAFSAQLSSHLRHAAGTDPDPALVLRQLGYLLATGPLSAATRAAAWQTIARLPGLHLCGTATDLTGRSGQSLCINDAEQQDDILVDAHTGRVLAVDEHLVQQSDLYPNVPDGALIGSITFTGS